MQKLGGMLEFVGPITDHSNAKVRGMAWRSGDLEICRSGDLDSHLHAFTICADVSLHGYAASLVATWTFLRTRSEPVATHCAVKLSSRLVCKSTMRPKAHSASYIAVSSISDTTVHNLTHDLFLKVC